MGPKKASWMNSQKNDIIATRPFHTCENTVVG